MDKNQYFNDMNEHDDNFPESFSWENMEAGIMDKLEDLENASEPFPSRRQWTYISSIIGLCFLAGLWICFIQNANKDISTETAITEVLSENNAVTEGKSALNIFNTDLNANIDRQSKQNSVEDDSAVINVSDKEATVGKQKTDKKIAISSTAHILAKNEIENSIPTSAIVDISIQTSSIDVNHSSFKETHQKELREEEQIDLVKKLETLNLLQQINTKQFDLDFALDIKEVRAMNEEEKGRKNNSKWSLGIYAGLTDWKPNYKGNDLAEMKFEAEKSIASYGVQAKLMYDLNENWQIGTGLEFMQRESRFAFYGERDSTVIQNVVTSIDVNSETGETITENREDIALNAVLWENVVHYNKYQQVAIPLLINRKWALSEKFFVNTGTGLRYVLSASETGKDLVANAGAYQTKNIKAGDYAYKNSLGLLANTSINYQFSKKWNFGVSADFNWSLTDVDNQTDVSLKPFGVFAAAGLQYRF